MPKITSYKIKLEVFYDDGTKEIIDASDVYSKEIEFFLDGVEEEQNHADEA